MSRTTIRTYRRKNSSCKYNEKIWNNFISNDRGIKPTCRDNMPSIKSWFNETKNKINNKPENFQKFKIQFFILWKQIKNIVHKKLNNFWFFLVFFLSIDYAIVVFRMANQDKTIVIQLEFKEILKLFLIFIFIIYLFI